MKRVMVLVAGLALAVVRSRGLGLVLLVTLVAALGIVMDNSPSLKSSTDVGLFIIT